MYDCFGAGQKVSQLTFERPRLAAATPVRRSEMFAVLPIMRQLHELLWYLSEALTLPAARRCTPSCARALAETERLTDATLAA